MPLVLVFVAQLLGRAQHGVLAAYFCSTPAKRQGGQAAEPCGLGTVHTTDQHVQPFGPLCKTGMEITGAYFIVLLCVYCT